MKRNGAASDGTRRHYIKVRGVWGSKTANFRRR